MDRSEELDLFIVTLCDESGVTLPTVDGRYVAVPGKKFGVSIEPRRNGWGLAMTQGIDYVYVNLIFDGGVHDYCVVSAGSRSYRKAFQTATQEHPYVFAFPKYAEEGQGDDVAPARFGTVEVQVYGARPTGQLCSVRGGDVAPTPVTVPSTKKFAARMVTVGSGEPVPYTPQRSYGYTRDIGCYYGRAVVSYATAEMLEADGVLDPTNNKEHRKYFPATRDWTAAQSAPVRVKLEPDAAPRRSEDITTIDLTDENDVKISTRKRKREEIADPIAC